VSKDSPDFYIGQFSQAIKDLTAIINELKIEVSSLRREVFGLKLWKASVLGASAAVAAVVSAMFALAPKVATILTGP